MADSQTLIGETILVNGNLTGDEDLLVLGKVEGSITLAKTLHVQESGIVKANVQVRNAIISGIVVGNIQATDAVEITEKGRMVGDIKAPRVIIVEGAAFRGHVDMGDLEAPRPTGTLPNRSDLKGTSPTNKLLGSARATSSVVAARPATASAAKPITASLPARPQGGAVPARPAAAPPRPPAPPAKPAVTTASAAAAVAAKKKVVVKKR